MKNIISNLSLQKIEEILKYQLIMNDFYLLTINISTSSTQVSVEIDLIFV